MRFPALVFFLLATIQAAAAPPPVTLEPFASGFSNPVEIAYPKDASGRLFVVEQPGRIRIVRKGQILLTPFLDISAANGGPVRFGGEQGLLGLAFHPQYAVNGFFYVFYTRALAGDVNGDEIVVQRFTRSAANPDLADPASAFTIITIPHPTFGNHNGGKIAFGPGPYSFQFPYLYIAVGDGGGGGDPFSTAQSTAQLRGKILRLDVNAVSPYGIPPGNSSTGRPEVFHVGLRNPWRFSFDRTTGDLYIADVGQNLWEEIDFVPRSPSDIAMNFGWSVFEGTHCFNPSTGCSLAGHTPPVIEYPHDSTGGFSVTGGYVYRGKTLPALQGYYVYGDYVSGRIWAARASEGWTPALIASLGNLSTFGEDESGELYAADHVAGAIWRVTPSAATLPRLANISTRARVLTGDDVLIAGFSIAGDLSLESKSVVINVAGPSLASAGIANPLANPTLSVVRSGDGALIAVNDDWQSQAQAGVAAIQASGFQPNHPQEPAVLLNLSPGNYTAIVSGVGGSTGAALVGLFEVDHPEVALANISTRARVQTGDDVMIAGFIVQGSQAKRMVVNVAGPSLSGAGVSGPLANPTLTVVRASDNFIMGTNDDWQSQANPADVAAIQASGFQPNHPAEPALILNLLPGAYTAIVQGAGGGTGVALVGAFAVP